MVEHFPAKAAMSTEHENTKIKQASKSEDPVIKNIIERIEKIERWIEMQTPPALMIENSSNLKDFELWNQVLLKLQQTLSKPSFDTWFSGTIAKLLDEDVMLVLCKNEFQSDWLSERYKEVIFFTVEEVAGRTFELEFATVKSLEKVLS
ncbi:DnaA N-terminal domain-containing protein [Neobacillus fumarioli]|uniref:DnaA N-terminal domain-containing protein n=1 Tax=Neobacillus fumarioli TaxID=105229 RepID=UPI00082ED688|nr:DnaA N-terminal domain-containing protein [Neobacillus fumarioli]